MLKQKAAFISRLAMAIDLALVALAFVAASGISPPADGELWSRQNLLLLVLLLPLWLFLLLRKNFYGSLRRRTLFDLVTALLNVHLLGGALSAAVIFLLAPDRFDRPFLLSFVLLSFLLLTLEKVAARLAIGLARRRGYNYRNLLIVGTGSTARRLRTLVEEYADWGLRIAGYLRGANPRRPVEVEPERILGELADLVAVCKQQTVDEVIFCLEGNQIEIADVESFYPQLRELGITVRMVLGSFETAQTRRELGFFDELPVMTLHSRPFDPAQLFAKRLLDIVGALVGLFLTAGLYPFIALAIKWDSPGPVLFSQQRVGENGRLFRIWKFRSMSADAERRRRDLEERNEMQGAVFKMREDPRITRVGAFLRKTSLDELPQFWNVLKGEMSLVGSRPPTPEEVNRYQNWHRRRISVRPGLTGLWQVSGRNTISDFDEIVRLDLRYIDHWSLWLDVRIIARTLGVLVRRRGSW